MSTKEAPRDARDDAPGLRGGSGEQVVEFYETEAFLTESIAAFLAPTLESRGSVIVVSTPRHQRQVEIALRSRGIDLGAELSTGRYTALDVAGTLRRFMIAGRLDGGRFRDVIGPLIERARVAGGQVRIYSEMVAHLYADGNVAATMRLGELWQQLRTHYEFTLLCAYPMRAFAGEGGDRMFDRICAQHTAVIPSDPFPLSGSRAEQELAIARLQREVVALRVAVTRVQAEQQRFDELAHVDQLTGLGNRRAFSRHVDRERMLARRSGRDSILVLVDLDDFKGYNDNHGHAAGDELLRRVATVLYTSARATDIVCRIGGDEFAAILIDCSHANAVQFERRVHATLRDSDAAKGPAVRVSVGRASLLEASSADEAFRRADAELYRHKDAGLRRAGRRQERGSWRRTPGTIVR